METFIAVLLGGSGIACLMMTSLYKCQMIPSYGMLCQEPIVLYGLFDCYIIHTNIGSSSTSKSKHNIVFVTNVLLLM